MRMRRQNIDHILRAAAEATGQKKFVLVGSAAAIVRLKHVPLNMTYTPEIDIYAPDAEDVELVSEIIDGSIGQLSHFHNAFGYYGDGVSPSTAKMPTDWLARATEYRPVDRPDIVAIVPDQEDVGLAKLVAWREKDRDWLSEAVSSGVGIASEDGRSTHANAGAKRRRKPPTSRRSGESPENACPEK